MAFFRRKRVSVGEFVAPEPQPLAPVDDVVHDALKIARQGVRMTVKNHLIVNALRDGLDFDEHGLEEVAAAEYRSLAAASLEGAERAQKEIVRGETMERRVFPGGKPVVVEPDHLRKPLVLRQVAEAYEAAAADTEGLAAVIAEAKRDAWSEVGGTLTSRLTADRVEDDPEYLAFRDERIARFVQEDLLTALRAAREA